MRAGTLRHKIEFVTDGETQDEFGCIVLGDVSYAFSMAEIKPVSGNEKFIANQVFPEATAQIRCRYVPSITPSHTIIFGSRRFNILNVQNKDERNIELYIVAKEVF